MGKAGGWSSLTQEPVSARQEINMSPGTVPVTAAPLLLSFPNSSPVRPCLALQTAEDAQSLPHFPQVLRACSHSWCIISAQETFPNKKKNCPSWTRYCKISYVCDCLRVLVLAVIPPLPPRCHFEN